MHDLQTIAKYQIRGLLRRGGMGALYLAYDPELERQVVIKLLRDDIEDPSVRERFSREAKAVARLRHPNVVTIFEYGIHDGKQYIVMEYIPGETFADLIRRRAVLSLERKLELMEGVCAGLAYAHAAGIVHRDIKPANLMLDVDGNSKVLDFGIAQTGAATLTLEGNLIGTLNYMSPEQLMSGRGDIRSDVFAVGAVLYELIAYQQAFPGDLSDGLAARIVHSEPSPLATLCPDLRPGLLRTAAKALDKRPEERYQDLTALKSDLARMRELIRTEQPTAIEVRKSNGKPDLSLRTGATTVRLVRLLPRNGESGRAIPIAAAAAAAAVLSIGAALAWQLQAEAGRAIEPPEVRVIEITASAGPFLAPLPETPLQHLPIGPAPASHSSDSRSAERRHPTDPTVPGNADAARGRESVAPGLAASGSVTPVELSPLDSRQRTGEPVPLPRPPGQEVPQVSVPAVPDRAASEDSSAPAPPAPKPANESVSNDQQVRDAVQAHVRKLSSRTQQVELLSLPVVQIGPDNRAAAATCTLRFRNQLRPGAAFDRTTVFDLRKREGGWEIVNP
jgi:predicted Ser/Thr protein kinase